MPRTREQKAEILSNALVAILIRISDSNDDVRDIAYTRTIYQLENRGRRITAKGLYDLRAQSLDIPPKRR